MGRPKTPARTPRDTLGKSYAGTPSTRRRMQKQRTRDTAPEMAIRRLLHAAGLRYRVDFSPLPGSRRRADLVFTSSRVAVFVDGCFWHGCPIHGSQSRTNSQFWSQKIESNVLRDNNTDAALRDADWLPLRVWEHEDPALAAKRVQAIVTARRKPRY
ncbi:very short patch repair endonuclease [Geodermatophilus sp. DSM 45219]|uniref:very short patch repair endonuclease n=1 Tax=Geodermatophilus sp. DSM 45219 TaxID=1881103 RepID=UPI0021011FD8|nr:very short patch repair endonuclease [Geodermatophilus sp. DSM 45219]